MSTKKTSAPAPTAAPRGGAPAAAKRVSAPALAKAQAAARGNDKAKQEQQLAFGQLGATPGGDDEASLPRAESDEDSASAVSSDDAESTEEPLPAKAAARVKDGEEKAPVEAEEEDDVSLLLARAQETISEGRAEAAKKDALIKSLSAALRKAQTKDLETALVQDAAVLNAARAAQPVTEVFKTQAPTVTPLTLANANKADGGRIVQQWMFALKQRWSIMNRDPARYGEQCVKEAMAWADYEMNIWFDALVKNGTIDPTSFDSLLRAVQHHFVPFNDAEMARKELGDIRQSASEAVDSYLARAFLLHIRAGEYATDSSTMHLAFDRMNKRAYPYTAMTVAAMLENKTIRSFASLRDHLVRLAAREPEITRNTPAAAAYQGGSNQAPKKINAVGTTPGAGDQNNQQVAAIGAKGPRESGPAPPFMNCNKCGGKGHRAGSCTADKDIRDCWTCGQTGHIKGSPKCSGLKA